MPITPGWPLVIIGQGIEGAKPRDANFYNIVTTANCNTQGGSHFYRQYFVMQNYTDISATAAALAAEVIHHNYNVNRAADVNAGKLPAGRSIDLYSIGTSVRAVLEDAITIAGGTKVCSGSTTPKAVSKALFQIKCGDEVYIGSNLYYFAKAMGDGKLRPLQK